MWLVEPLSSWLVNWTRNTITPGRYFTASVLVRMTGDSAISWFGRYDGLYRSRLTFCVF